LGEENAERNMRDIIENNSCLITVTEDRKKADNVRVVKITKPIYFFDNAFRRIVPEKSFECNMKTGANVNGVKNSGKRAGTNRFEDFKVSGGGKRWGEWIGKVRVHENWRVNN
jgi:hypothetical protein